ncbi:MAG: EAL domain-containing protein [Alphaproteobacteria bacterium]|nr:EAL domain-containing protein [Alphaproteobacteria bacterium]
MNKTMLAVLSIFAICLGIGIEFFTPQIFPFSGWTVTLISLISILIMEIRQKQNVIKKKLELLENRVEASDLKLISVQEQLDIADQKLNNSPENKQVASELRMLRTLMKKFADKVNDNVSTNNANSVSETAEKPQTKISEPILNYTNSEILQFLEKAVREDHIELYLQPIVLLPQRSHAFFECFSRIADDNGNIIRPEQYLPVANSAGLTASVDNLMLFKYVQLVRRARRNKPNIIFFCNISKSTLTDVDFFTDFIDFMADNINLTTNLVFEFNQETILDNDFDIQNGLQRLSKLGFRLSMDQLQNLDLALPKLASQGFKFIKIDAHFLHEIARGTAPTLNMKALKGALDREAMDLIVEKIENEEMLLDLLDLKIDYGQGYLFGAPKPAEIRN